MSVLADLTGQRFGRLMIVERSSRLNGMTAWVCRCDCGTVRAVRTNSLRMGASRSCGCLGPAASRAAHSRHGGWGTPTYRAWVNMKQRCINRGRHDYRYYGGRGIKFCERWGHFEAFLADMGLRPSSAHSLDRHPNNDGNYEPGNCRWALKEEQIANRRNARVVDYGGERMSLGAACASAGIKYSTAWDRLKAGWPVEKALSP